jgi:RNA-dependent RNA polymerase
MFKKNIDEDSTFFKMKNAFQDYNITMTDSAEIKIMARQPANVWSLIDPPETPLTKHWFEDNRATSYRLSFEVRYQLEVCISNGYLNEYNITKEFVDKLSKFESKKGRSILEYVAEQEIRWYDPMLIFSDEAAMEYSPSSKIPNYCAYSRKATITPSTMYFNSPTVETTNRVIRQYAAFGDRFLRVQFTDEKAEVR